MKKKFSLFLLICLAFCACKKERSELDKLPAATQTGANTFGCLVNGRAWIAGIDCSLLCPSAILVDYDPAKGGHISIKTKYLNLNENADQSIGIGLDSVKFKRIYKTQPDSLQMGVNYRNSYAAVNCRLFLPNDPKVISKGLIQVTKFDLAQGIIAGTFDYTVSIAGCETVHFTNGRFDVKL